MRTGEPRRPGLLAEAEGLRSAFPVRLAQAYGRAHAGNYAAAVAFTMFMSMFPLILGLLAILGLVISDAGNRAALEGPILGFFPADSRGALHGTLDGVQQHPGIFGIVGILGLLWSGGNIFTSLEFALSEILGSRRRDFVRQRLMALGMTGIFVVAVVVSVGVNSVVAFASGLPLFGPLAGALVWIGFMATIYRFVPARHFRLSQVWRGAVLAGVLMELLTLLWPLYTSLTHGFNTYGATFALFFLLASWLYFLSQLILLGAVANGLEARRGR